jgi:hypothetical protein
MHSIEGLYLEAIRSNRSNGSAYYHLDAALGAAEVVTLMGESYEQQLHLEAFVILSGSMRASLT